MSRTVPTLVAALILVALSACGATDTSQSSSSAAGAQGHHHGHPAEPGHHHAQLHDHQRAQRQRRRLPGIEQLGDVHAPPVGDGGISLPFPRLDDGNDQRGRSAGPAGVEFGELQQLRRLQLIAVC
jgi:hypothetical protein